MAAAPVHRVANGGTTVGRHEQRRLPALALVRKIAPGGIGEAVGSCSAAWLLWWSGRVDRVSAVEERVRGRSEQLVGDTNIRSVVVHDSRIGSRLISRCSSRPNVHEDA